MKKITIYADGSCLGNPGAGGWAAILEYSGSRKIVSGGEAHTTNNKMELTAVIEAMKLLKEACEVTIVTDSSYVSKGINEWLAGWIKKDFKDKKNVELWKSYIEVAKIHKVKAVWVRGHSGHPENEECDKIAKEEAEKYTR